MGEYIKRYDRRKDRWMDGWYSSHRWINNSSWVLIIHWSHSLPDLLVCWTRRKMTKRLFCTWHVVSSLIKLLIKRMRVCMLHEIRGWLTFLSRAHGRLLEWCSIIPSPNVLHSSIRVLCLKLWFLFYYLIIAFSGVLKMFLMYFSHIGLCDVYQ